jgi:formyltetrahydrofolate-dependent phosphoribosylglycinamide formyltransferase
MEALLHHQAKGCAHRTVIVISNKSGVKGLNRAASLGVPTLVIEVDNRIKDLGERREAHEHRLLSALDLHEVEAIILSGYMRVLSPLFVRDWKGRLLNIHPSLLPKYPGAHAHRDALADGAEVTGCTVHLVDEGVDSGPILAQAEVEVLDIDDEDSLSERVRAIEHEIYPTTIDAFATGEITAPDPRAD